MGAFKLIVTVGPSSISKSILIGLDKAGADCFRINLSHSNEEEYYSYFQALSNAGIRPCIDTQGAQGRIIEVYGNKNLKEGESVDFLFGSHQRNMRKVDDSNEVLVLNHKEIIEQVSIDDILRIDFSGLIIKIKTIDRENKSFKGVVIAGGTCEKNRAFDIANKPLILKPHTEFDIWAIKESTKHSCPAIFHSFAESAEDIKTTRSLCKGQSKVIAKIESRRGLESIKEIATASDGILIDRGDLSREISISMVPVAVNLATKLCVEIEKPIYVATNVLDSLMSNSLPSRAEISDIHNMLTMGVTGMVLAAEVAIGARPIESVQVVNHIRKIVEAQKLGILGIFNSNDLKTELKGDLAHWL
ncbi:pyruvate kinase [Synechococcus sp. BL107]|uniref:pyruvate kinase n=1 Tax=Synechococcus sp. BL107 TaxID=313625 RepID=UPI0000E53B92|nr:pyruvate kinase [Synechococcus sp. BL107]EAU71041.1 pyruvate kinase [Synechococcus sp. BL107]